jgi:hypothetical protein
MEDHPIIASIVIIILGFLLLVGISAISDNKGVADYNGGVCKLCGGHYVYDTTIGHAYTTEYIYICKDCGNMLYVGTYMGR